MYLEELESRGVSIKNLVCQFLAKKYETSADDIENDIYGEQKENNLYTFKMNEIVDFDIIPTAHIFSDFTYSKDAYLNIVSPYYFNSVWIKIIYNNLLKYAPEMAENYLKDLKNVLKLSKIRHTEYKQKIINKQFEYAIRTAENTRNQELRVLKENGALFDTKLNVILNSLGKNNNSDEFSQ